MFSFQNLGIIHIAKRDTREIVMTRRWDELINHARIRKPYSSYEEIKNSITTADRKRVSLPSLAQQLIID